MSVAGFYFLKSLDDFAKYKIVQNKMDVFTVDHTLQELHSDYCRLFQFYFQFNLFESYENSIVTYKKNTKLDHKH